MSFINLLDEEEKSVNKSKNEIIDLTGSSSSSEDEEDDETETDDVDDNSESSDDSDLEAKFVRPATTIKKKKKEITVVRQRKNKRKSTPVEIKSFNMYALSGKKMNIITKNRFKKYSDDTFKRQTSSGKLFNCDTKCFKKYTSKHTKFNNKLKSMGYLQGYE